MTQITELRKDIRILTNQIIHLTTIIHEVKRTYARPVEPATHKVAVREDHPITIAIMGEMYESR